MVYCKVYKNYLLVFFFLIKKYMGIIAKNTKVNDTKMALQKLTSGIGYEAKKIDEWSDKKISAVRSESATVSVYCTMAEKRVDVSNTMIISFCSNYK